MNNRFEVHHPSFAGFFGVARRDITPPAGIYARMWGSAQHDVAEGVHRPLTATAIAIATDRGQPFVLGSLDLGWWRSRDEEIFFRSALLRELSLEESQLMIHLTHTHAGPSISLQAENKPGGDKIRPYVLSVRAALKEAIKEALQGIRRATLSWHAGRCNLACHRDQPLPDGVGTVVGYAPEQRADDTVLVGRVTDGAGRILSTLVNYACHPTTLGWANRLISPDYVGAMRETVEQATDGAPCLFLQGASGELAPRRQYNGEPEVADQNGRQLGYAVLATLEDMLPHECGLRFTRVEESTARLGFWELVDSPLDLNAIATQIDVKLSLRDRSSDLSKTSTDRDDPASIERIERLLHRWTGFENERSAAMPIWLWRLGGTVIVGVPGEMHSRFQVDLRRQFSEYAVVVLNLVNGSYGYLAPMADYLEPTYQCVTSLFQAGAHETVAETCVSAIELLTADNTSDSSVAKSHIKSRSTV